MYLYTMQNTDIYSLKLRMLNGEEQEMSLFKGKYLLIVNTASACGYTPQYEGLEELHKTYAEKLEVLGLPCNDFGAQEPGTEDEIQAFCTGMFGVSFPLSAKVNIKTEPIHPLIEWLTKSSLNGVSDATINWNFNKFLVSPDGKWMQYFPSSVKPLDEQIIALIK